MSQQPMSHQTRNAHSRPMPVLEMVLYRVQPGVTDDAVLAISDEIQRWLEQQPGYLRRELFMAESGEWLDIVYWATMADAVAASEQIFRQPFAAGFGAIFAPDATALHLYQVRDYRAMTLAQA